jgi:hypothetical protein
MLRGLSIRYETRLRRMITRAADRLEFLQDLVNNTPKPVVTTARCLPWDCNVCNYGWPSLWASTNERESYLATACHFHAKQVFDSMKALDDAAERIKKMTPEEREAWRQEAFKEIREAKKVKGKGGRRHD